MKTSGNLVLKSLPGGASHLNDIFLDIYTLSRYGIARRMPNFKPVALTTSSINYVQKNYIVIKFDV